MKLLLVFLLLATGVWAETGYERVYKVYKKEEYKQALEKFKRLAIKENDYDAAYILGYMYEHGEGTPINKEESQKWYQFSSHGYYWQNKNNPSRDIEKEEKKLFTSINHIKDSQTMETIKQIAESKYSFKAHHSNYFLPVSYRFNASYPDTNGHQAHQTETEFQVSLKYDFAANLFGLNEVYTMAYTQRSFWQLYANSAYFRETNYNPEFFFTVPVAHIQGFEYFKAFRFGFEHKSNGRGGADERSWNYLSGRFFFQTGSLFTVVEVWKDVGSLEYNEDLMDYLGYGKLTFLLPYKKHLFTLISRNTFSDKRATELNYSYPLSKDNNLFVYVKGFTGYGESLIDYNNKLDKIGIGFSISR